MRIWTETAKAAQREAIKRWQPWAWSTGPRTSAGKERSALNARKGCGAMPVKALRLLRAALGAQSKYLRACKAYMEWRQEKNSEKRTIMMMALQRLMNRLHREFLSGVYRSFDLWKQDEELEERLYTPDMRIAA